MNRARDPPNHNRQGPGGAPLKLYPGGARWRGHASGRSWLPGPDRDLPEAPIALPDRDQPPGKEGAALRAASDRDPSDRDLPRPELALGAPDRRDRT